MASAKVRKPPCNSLKNSRRKQPPRHASTSDKIAKKIFFLRNPNVFKDLSLRGCFRAVGPLILVYFGFPVTTCGQPLPAVSVAVLIVTAALLRRSTNEVMPCHVVVPAHGTAVSCSKRFASSSRRNGRTRKPSLAFLCRLGESDHCVWAIARSAAKDIPLGRFREGHDYADRGTSPGRHDLRFRPPPLQDGGVRAGGPVSGFGFTAEIETG